MIQEVFANKAKLILASDPNVTGVAVGGSWLTNELDEFSDLDLIVVTRQKISHDKSLMLEYAAKLGKLLSGFTGEHVGEPRVLICLYDEPLLHVDIKFLTIEEFHQRVETPTFLLDRDGALEQVIGNSEAIFPHPNFQWIEDRFWTWIHYSLLKIGRGEYLEAYDFMGFLRMAVFGPLLHLKNGNLPRGVRKVETELGATDLGKLISTIPSYNRASLLESLKNGVLLYQELQVVLYDNKVELQNETAQRVLAYFDELALKK